MSEYKITEWHDTVLDLDFWMVTQEGLKVDYLREGNEIDISYSHFHASGVVRYLAEKDATIQAQQANLQIAAELLEEERAKSDRYKAEISRFRGAMKDIIDNIFRGKWTPDRVRRYAIEVCQGVETETEGEA